MIDRACISLNNNCNLKCKYCHFANKNIANPSELTSDNAEKIIKNIADYCRDNNLDKFKLGIVGSGEPFLSYNSLKAIVIEADKYGNLFSLYTITNGISLTNEQLQFFYEHRSLIELNFSLDGNEEIHNNFRQGYEKTIETINRYKEIFGIAPRINATITRKSLQNKEQLVNYFKSNGFDRVNFSCVSDVADPKIAVNREEYEDFLNSCFQHKIIMRQKNDENKDKYDCTMYGKNCGVGRTNIFITKQGIYPCGRFFGLDDYRLGDLHTSLRDIELSFSKLKHIEKGLCYFDVYVGKKK
ncbi:MAG: radical SAM protein [Oscillospiraceae bacterium]|jgi:uncharacterized protein|nr:radical SAM protein [Oscillospiraceae bacterium]